MKFIPILVFVLLSLTTVQAQKASGKLFIIGGGDRPDALMNRLIDEAGVRQGGYVIVLPMSSAEPDSAVYYAQQQFNKLGIHAFAGLNFKKGETWPASRLDSVRNAKLIYISGGDQNRFMDVVRSTPIEKAIHDAFTKGCVVSGSSAGAAVMSKIMITGNELKHPDYESTFKNIEADNIETKPGLGLVSTAIVDQHFIRRSRHNRLISAVIEYPDMMGIGIDESTAVLITGKQVEVVGASQVLVFENKKRSKEQRNGKLGAKGIVLSVYLPGEKFSL
jgi:cyanophycinase